MCDEWSRSNGPGVAETNTSCLVIDMNSSNVWGRLSSALGSRKPYSTSVVLRERSPSYMAPIWGTVWCDSSMKHDEVVGEEVDQAVGPVAGLAAVQDPRVVLDPVAEAQLAQHLHVELGALAQPVALQRLALRLQLLGARLQLVADLGHRAVDRLLVGGVVGGRPHAHVLDVLEHLAGQRIELLERLDLVAEQHRPVGGLGVGGEHLQRVAPDPERPTSQRGVVARCTGCPPACAAWRRGRSSRRP